MDWRNNPNLKVRIGTEYNDFCIIYGNPKIGKNTWVGFHTLIDGSGGLEIGENCSIASGVHIYTHDSVRWAINGLKKDGKHIDRKPVKIGNNVFIGANSIILKGVTIGDKSIIGAGTIVNKDIPSNSVVYGNPMVFKK